MLNLNRTNTKLNFTDHAKFRLLERSVSTEDIKATIRNSDISVPRPGGKTLARKRFKEYELMVVYAKKNNDYRIITVIKR